MLKKNYLIYSISVLLIIYLIGVFSGLFKYLGKYFLSFDNQIREFLVNLQTPFWDGFFNIVTLFGEARGLAGIGIIGVGIFLLYRKRNFLLPFIITIIGTEAFIWIGKVFTGRIRPTGEECYLSECSFPSNHAAIALAFYGFIFLVINNKKTENRNFLLQVTSYVLLITIVLIGFSRLYLGVHFLSDIMMGYIVAGLWLSLVFKLRVR